MARGARSSTRRFFRLNLWNVLKCIPIPSSAAFGGVQTPSPPSAMSTTNTVLPNAQIPAGSLRGDAPRRSSSFLASLKLINTVFKASNSSVACYAQNAKRGT